MVNPSITCSIKIFYFYRPSSIDIPSVVDNVVVEVEPSDIYVTSDPNEGQNKTSTKTGRTNEECSKKVRKILPKSSVSMMGNPDSGNLVAIKTSSNQVPYSVSTMLCLKNTKPGIQMVHYALELGI
jgi:hypothetical protein